MLRRAGRFRRRGGAYRCADPRPAAAADAVGLRLRTSRPGGKRLDAGGAGRVHRGRSGGASRPAAGRGQPRPHRPGDRGERRRTIPDGALRRALRRGRLASGGAHPAECHADHRPARRRGRALGRPSQEVAAVRQQGADRRRPGRRRRWRSPRRVLPDLPRDRGPCRLPDPGRVRLPRRLGGLRALRDARGCSSRRPQMARRRRPSSWSAAGRASSSRTAG